MDPTKNVITGHEGWDALAQVWAERVGDTGDPSRSVLLDPATLSLLGDVEGRRVLDAGCGEGRFARMLARRGAQVTGVDLSEAMLARALDQEQRQPQGIRFLRSDLADLSGLDTGAFDAVVANMSFQDVEDYRSAMGEVARVLAPGGQFVFSILHPCFTSLGVEPGLGWEFTDPVKRTSPQFYKVDRYFDREPTTILMWRDVPIRVPHYHRTLSDYVGALRATGFCVRDLAEPAPDAQLVAEHPNGWERNRRIPYFLIFDALRTG